MNALHEAAELRSRAAAIRAEIDEQARALEERRQADEAGDLEAQAVRLEVEQERVERAAELRRQADAADASAGELDIEADQLDGEMLDAAIRANRFARQITADVTGRREQLERAASSAAEAGDAEAVMAAERDLTLLPTLQARLQEQVDTADAQAAGLNRRAAELEARADEARHSAIALRRWADLDPLSPTAPPLPELEQTIARRAQVDAGAALQAREAALRAVRATPDADSQDAAAALFAREINAALAERARTVHAQDIATLEDVSGLVERVRDAAVSESHRRLHAPVEVQFTAPIAGVERAALTAAVAGYRARLGRDLPICHDLATNAAFGIVERRLYPDRFAADVTVAAEAAAEELAGERAALDTAE